MINSEFSKIKGKTLIDIRVGDNYIEFYTKDGIAFYQTPSDGSPNDCYVFISDINGDLNDLINTPILRAEEKTNVNLDEFDSDFTWTFYTLATIKGFVDITWKGSSNGFYSETPDFYEFTHITN